MDECLVRMVLERENADESSSKMPFDTNIKILCNCILCHLGNIMAVKTVMKEAE